MSVEVQLPRRGLRFPSSCAACGERATSEVRLFEYRPWDSVHVPVCGPCRTKVFIGLLVRRVLVVAFGTAGALVAQELLPGWLLHTFRTAEALRPTFQFFWVAGAFVGAMPVVLLVQFLWPARIDVSLNKGTVTFTCLNEAWADELQRLNVKADDD
ncbi:MAG: hypothetical protein Q8L14_28865 [Myxococcales bacterium]|nr:hypothetical protein [Myxococcales bacterium]